MNAREFYDTVKAMRENQRNYLLTKQNRYLSELKRLEHIIDGHPSINLFSWLKGARPSLTNKTKKS